MSGEIEKLTIPAERINPVTEWGVPSVVTGSTEWLVVNQRTTAGAMIVESTPRASGTTTPCTKNWMHLEPRFSFLSTSSDHFSSAQWEEARPWRRSSRWWRRWSARVHQTRVFGRCSRRNFHNIIS